MATATTLPKHLQGAFKANSVAVDYAKARPELIEQSGAFIQGMATGVFHFPRQNEHAAADREMIYEDRHRIVNVSTARTQRLIGINQADDSHQRLLAAEALARAAKAKDPRWMEPRFAISHEIQNSGHVNDSFSMTKSLQDTKKTAPESP